MVAPKVVNELSLKPNRVAGGFSPPAPTPPTVRVRSGRFNKLARSTKYVSWRSPAPSTTRWTILPAATASSAGRAAVSTAPDGAGGMCRPVPIPPRRKAEAANPVLKADGEG